MEIELIDIGVNLSNSRLFSCLEAVLQRAATNGIAHLIATSSNLQDCLVNQKINAKHPEVFYTVGVHPHDAQSWQDDTAEKLLSFTQLSGAVAIGETGLDYNRMYSNRTSQRQAFVQQMELAKNCALPVFLHQRDAFADTLAILKDFPRVPFVWHCFTGNRSELEQALALGAYIGITGWICDERRNQSLLDCLTFIPPDRLMLESDAPYLTPRNMRPRPAFNEPAYLPVIIDEISRHMQRDSAFIAAQSTANARRFFKLT